MKLSEDLKYRGQVKDYTFGDLSWIDKPKTFYLGTDCSSDSLQVGNLAVYMLARRLMSAGWTAVLLVGGATSLVGDPGGKNEERELKPREEIQKNVKGIEKQVKRLFDDKDFTLVDNYDWFKDIGYLEFLRDVGKHYSITELLQRDFVSQRVGKDGPGISYAEFSYSLIQGYDYWHLFKKHNVVLQIGGSDQWGNMLSGVPLVRKKEGKEVHALSMPLVINKSTGAKFGKSEEGALWLDETKTSAFKFYQFWLNVDDDSVEDYLKIYTMLSKEEIDKVMKEFSSDKSARIAQKRLADEVTKIVHGKDSAQATKNISQVLFGGSQFLKLKDSDKKLLQSELKSVNNGPSIQNTLVSAGLATSNTEANRFIDTGAISINGEKVFNVSEIKLVKGPNLIKRGKNKFAVVVS